jgi:hypothetical protein
LSKKIKAIQTKYQGDLFRSRLEARWAVFFHELGIEYWYEHEGYDLDDTWYLPDFYLPKQDCFIEIKATSPTEEEVDKAIKLVTATNKFVYIFYGKIPLIEAIDFDFEKYDYDGSARAYFPMWDEAGKNVAVGDAGGFIWIECKQCNVLGVNLPRAGVQKCSCLNDLRKDLAGWREDKRKKEYYKIINRFIDENHDFKSTELIAAYRKATQARFEHGCI